MVREALRTRSAAVGERIILGASGGTGQRQINLLIMDSKPRGGVPQTPTTSADFLMPHILGNMNEKAVPAERQSKDGKEREK